MDSARKVRVAINGFGRIGRNAFKVAFEDHLDELEIVALNDLTEPKVLAHLLEYDTAYGHWDKVVSSNDIPTTVGAVSSKGSLVVDGHNIPIFAEKDPKTLPWKDLQVDVVIESTGRFTKEEEMQQHITAGAKRVVLSAPAKDGNVGTFLIGVNHDKYRGEVLINNASCTSNCLAPVLAIVNEKFGIQKALYTTVHSVTAEQNLVDGPPPGGKTGDLRRARAAYANMIPTTTGAAIAVTQAIPEMKGFVDGRAIRVPTITGSITDFTVLLKRKTTVEEINQAFKDACETARWKGIVAWTQEPLVSSDIIGRSESSIVDLELTQVVDGDLVKIFAWYDNEWGYSNRLVEQVINVGKTVGSTSVSTPVVSAGEHQMPHPTPNYQAEFVPNPAPVLTSRITPLASQPDVNPAPAQAPLTLPLDGNHPPLEPRGFFTHDYNSTPHPQPSGFNPADASVNHVISPPATPPPLGPTLSVAPIQNSASPSVVSTPQPSPNVPSFVQPAASSNGQQNGVAQSTSTADQKPPEEPKIEDHIVQPGEEEHPKNNPFLNWFK